MEKKYRYRLALWILSVFLLAALLPGCGSQTVPGEKRAAVQETAQSAALQTAGEAEETFSKKDTKADTAASEGTESEKAESGEAGDPENGKDEEEVLDEAVPDEEGSYTSRDEVALYLYTYGHLPDNFITKNEAKKLGWDNSRGNLAEVAPGKSIGGDRFGNYEGLLPEEEGRRWTECDIGYEEGYRNGERIVFSNDGLIYYTGDHYKSFERLY